MKKLKNLGYEETIKKIMEKKEFSKLPIRDVKLIYSLFEKREDLILEEKIKFSRDLLRKMYTVFISEKLLNSKEKDSEWFLQKHISTKERQNYYLEIYKRCLDKIKNEKNVPINVFDFGCGINGFSYEFFLRLNYKVNYFGTEPVGQLCDLQNNWFKKNDFSGIVENLSLFDLEKNKELIKKQKGKKIIFLFKVLDSLEMVERNYSKKILDELVKISDYAVVSWATKSLVSKKEFKAKRLWLKKFISENFNVLDEFELGSENYVIFENK